MRICRRCKQEKDLTSYYFYAPGKLRNICKKCERNTHNKYMKTKHGIAVNRASGIKWRSENKEYHATQGREWWLKNRYGISQNSYDSILKDQDGVCKICGLVNTKGKRLAVDHDHKTGLVRGLLCGKCNTGLGSYNDNVELLEKAIWYLYYTRQNTLTNG